MKKHKNHFIAYYIVAALFYVLAIIAFVSGNDNSMGTTWLCLGSAFLCFGSGAVYKSKDNSDTKDNEEIRDE